MLFIKHEQELPRARAERMATCRMIVCTALHPQFITKEAILIK